MPRSARPGPRRRARARCRRTWRSSTSARRCCATTTASGRCRPRSTSTARRTVTSARCRPAATGSRCSSGSPRSRAIPTAGLPTVMGLVCLSDAATGAPLMLLDARSVTALRTGAVAAVASQALARAGGADGRDRRLRAARQLGRSLPARGRLRPWGLLRRRRQCRRAAGGEIANGWRAGSREEAVAQEIVCVRDARAPRS